jgi:hypothetical protein
MFTKEWCGLKNEQEIYFSITRAKRTPSAAATVQVFYALTFWHRNLAFKF